MKKIILGTSDAWSVSHSSQRPIVPATQSIILKIVGFHVKMTKTWGVQVPLAIDRFLFTYYYLIWDPPTQYHIINTM